ncbi:MAG: SRPBCC family protein, partial [Thermomicrobiales bacterium]
FMTTAEPTIVQVKREFVASPERVFDAWLDPARAGKWLFATPGGEMLQVEIDARVGGHFLIVERRPDGDADHYGTYLEIDRPRRLVFLFTTERYSVEGDRVTIDIVPTSSGCELTLTQVMSPQWIEYADRTKSGWTMILESLVRELAL